MKNPESCKNIEEIREAIDGIDYQIMKLFSERYGFVKEIVKFKTDEVSVIAENRQKEVIEKRRKWAVELGLNPDLFEDIFWTLMRYNVQKELEILKNTNANPV
jgi:isochorismate pyruvate lyase